MLCTGNSSQYVDVVFLYFTKAAGLVCECSMALVVFLVQTNVKKVFLPRHRFLINMPSFFCRNICHVLRKIFLASRFLRW